MTKQQPIGVFDSGMGGLTVVREIMQALPYEDIIYFGDIARLPYGTKSVATIRKFASQTVKFLLAQGVKAIVVACNTIAATAKDVVLEYADTVPVVDVITAGSNASAFSGKKIGVIATPATINSNAYLLAIHRLNPTVEVVSQACSLFVPMIEEGFTQHKALELVARDYLCPLLAQNINSLVLGCTHYPLIKKMIERIIGNEIKVIDPATTTCSELIRLLTSKNLLSSFQAKGTYRYFVTDLPLKFRENGQRFLNSMIDDLALVNID